MQKKRILAITLLSLFTLQLVLAVNLLGDLDGDGFVGSADLAHLLGSWGTCTEDPCPADLNNDSVVNQHDMTILLSQWGEIKNNTSTALTECGIITEPGAYHLENNVASGSSCFTVIANAVIDCRGNEIVYAALGEGNAFYLENTENAAIQNCIIVQENAGISNSAAIYSFNSNFNNFENNSIVVQASLSPGIYIEGGEKNNIAFNTIDVWGIDSRALGLYNTKTLFAIRNLLAAHTETDSALFIGNSVDTHVVENTLENEGETAAISTLGLTGSHSFSDNFIFALTPAFFVDADTGQDNASLTLYNNEIEGTNGSIIVLGFSDYSTTIELHDQRIPSYTFLGNNVYLTVNNTENGTIEFLEAIQQNGANLAEDIQIFHNLAHVNAENRTGFNVSSRVTFFGINETITSPAIFKNGQLCTDCIILSPLSNETIQFSVTGWSNYSVGESPLQPSALIEEVSEESEGGCVTTWTCDEWSACVEGSQTRTCKKERVQCYASYAQKPAEIQSCSLEALEETSEETTESVGNTISRITGAVIGAVQEPAGFGALLFILAIAGAYVALIVYRRRQGTKNLKNE